MTKTAAGKASRLKVYVTPAGFYDAVVAAPNQAAALKAWGARSNLFAEKLATVEDEPHWCALARSSPGEVIRKPRGDDAALLAAAPRRTGVSTQPKAAPAQAPPADRSALDAAEAALRSAQTRRKAVAARWAKRLQALEAQADEERDAADRVVAEAEAARERAASAFARASGRADAA